MFAEDDSIMPTGPNAAPVHVRLTLSTLFYALEATWIDDVIEVSRSNSVILIGHLYLRGGRLGADMRMDTKNTCGLKKQWSTYSKFANQSRLNSQQNWGDLVPFLWLTASGF